jgi:hypothetical protein
VTRVALAVLFSASAAAAQPAEQPAQNWLPSPLAKDTKPAAKTDPAEAEALAKQLRKLLEKKIPDPLTKSGSNWGHQTAVTVTRRYREGLRVWLEPVQELRNDGVWRRIEVRIPDPSKVKLDVTELLHAAGGKVLATVAASSERVDVRFEQQVWRNGVRLYSGETRAHCRAGLTVRAEVTPRAEFRKDKGLLPDVTLTVRVTSADLSYDDLVVDHTAGIGGDAARVVGDLILKTAKAVKPDLEADLLGKAEAAIVKAAGTREFKVALDKLSDGRAKK